MAARNDQNRDPQLAASQVEATRLALRQAVQSDLSARIDDYFEDTGPAEQFEASQSLIKTAGITPRPLRAIAEGDSWFDYPSYFLSDCFGGIVPRLAARLGANLYKGKILNLAHSGDEVRQILGVTQRTTLVESLDKAASKGIPFDALLFSGGGNDIVGDQLALWLNDRVDVAGIADALRTDVYESVLNVIMRGYEDLLLIRERHAPAATIFIHSYCIPFPRNRGVCGLGPWIFPAMKMRGWNSPWDQRAIVGEMLRRFDQRLGVWASSKSKVVHVNTLALEIPEHEWHNEIHPNSDGFNKVTALFDEAIRRHFELALQ